MLKAIRKSLGECPGASHTGVHQKNATPAESPSDINAVIETIRPSVLLPDRNSRLVETKENREILDLENYRCWWPEHMYMW